MSVDPDPSERPTAPPIPPKTRALPQGITWQCYRGAVPVAADKATSLDAKRLEWLAPHLDRFAAAGGGAVAWHGFSTELTADVFGPYALACASRGLAALATYGVDNTDAAGKGVRISKVAVLTECAGVGIDAEGKLDNDGQAFATVMGRALRLLAPDAFMFTQPWPLPHYHPHFPYAEFAAWTDVVCPQFYWMDWVAAHGGDAHAAYVTCMRLFEADWTALEKTLATKGLVRPRVPTIQARQSVPGDVADYLRRYDGSAVVWAEPVLSDAFYAGWKMYQGG